MTINPSDLAIYKEVFEFADTRLDELDKKIRKLGREIESSMNLLATWSEEVEKIVTKWQERIGNSQIPEAKT